jgi:hypothetical protein
VDVSDVDHWFTEYLEVFAACGRGQRPPGSVLDYWGIPLLLSTDEGFSALMSEAEVMTTAQQQIDGMLAAAYHHTAVLDSEVTVLNAKSALYRGEFSRRRASGDEISRLIATYLVSDGVPGRRISALLIHSHLMSGS